MIMRRLLRSVSEKSQLKAAEIILKCGQHLALAKNAVTAQTYEEWEWARHQEWGEERKRIDASREKRGLPPATESEFLIELEDERRLRDGLPLVEEPLTPAPLTRFGVRGAGVRGLTLGLLLVGALAAGFLGARSATTFFNPGVSRYLSRTTAKTPICSFPLTGNDLHQD